MNTDFRLNITLNSTVSRVHCNGLCTVSVPASSKVWTTTCFTGLLAASV